MGRIAGVTPAETQGRLLDTAAKVFARRGYDGASIAEITSEAGLSSGAVYAHHGSKAELFVATLRAHGDRELERLLGEAGRGGDVVSLLTARGTALDRRRAGDGSLLVEAIVAAKHHPEVARVLTDAFREREALLERLVRGGQEADALDAGVSAAAVARFTLMVALGSLLVAAMELPPPDHDDWAALIARLVDSFRKELR